MKNPFFSTVFILAKPKNLLLNFANFANAAKRYSKNGNFFEFLEVLRKIFQEEKFILLRIFWGFRNNK